MISVKYIPDEPLTESLNDDKPRSLAMNKSHFFDKKLLKNDDLAIVPKRMGQAKKSDHFEHSLLYTVHDTGRS